MLFFFFNDTATTEIYTLSLHDALPISAHYDVLSLSEFLDRLFAGKPMRRTASVTFDDAYAGVFKYAAPVLHELQITATVFVIANAPGRDERFWWDRAAVQRAEGGRLRREWLTLRRGDEKAILGSL